MNTVLNTTYAHITLGCSSIHSACRLNVFSKVLCLIQNDKDWTPKLCPYLTGFSSKHWWVMYYLCLNNLYTTKLGVDGAVVASGIVACLQITNQLLTGHRTSAHNWHKLAFQLGRWLHLHTWKKEKFFQGKSKYFAVVLRYLFRGNVFYRGSNLMRYSLGEEKGYQLELRK